MLNPPTVPLSLQETFGCSPVVNQITIPLPHATSNMIKSVHVAPEMSRSFSTNDLLIIGGLALLVYLGIRYVNNIARDRKKEPSFPEVEYNEWI